MLLTDDQRKWVNILKDAVKKPPDSLSFPKVLHRSNAASNVFPKWEGKMEEGLSTLDRVGTLNFRQLVGNIQYDYILEEEQSLVSAY